MSEQSDKWDRQWQQLLTHCYGEVEASSRFKANLLEDLKIKTAENRQAIADSEEIDSADDHNWSTLLRQAYVPCIPHPEFKSALLEQLKDKQTEITNPISAQELEEAFKGVLVGSPKVIAPRREFETRLLENLKERQRNTVVIRRSSRKKTIFLSAASSIAAAAMVMFAVAVWVMPADSEGSTATGTEIAMVQTPIESIPPLPSLPVEPLPALTFTSTTALADSNVVPAVATAPAVHYTSDYRIDDAFAPPALPATARGIRNMEFNTGDGWRPMEETYIASVSPGMAFRPADGSMGHISFGDGSILTMRPDAVLEATDEGLAVKEGFVLALVPESSTQRFRLHFPERDISVEPGTELAIMVESPANYAEGGAPAPTVMVDTGGLAIARGRNGSGPLFANQVYRLDNYVSASLPGRPACSADMKVFEVVRENNFNLASSLNAPGRGGSVDTYSTPVGFTKKDNRWVAESYLGEPTVKIKYLSDEYFGFANQRRDLASSLALGSDVVIDGGDGSFYEIYK